MHGAAYANLAVQAADLIIGIGYRFDDRTTGVISKYAPEARKAEAEGRGGIIHFDIEPSQIDKVSFTRPFKLNLNISPCPFDSVADSLA